MTVQELIEKLMEYPLDSEVVFAEMRYSGGDEYYEDELKIWREPSGIVFISPSIDAGYIKIM